MFSIRVLISILFLMASVIQAQVSGLSGWNIFLDPGHSQGQNVGEFGYPEAHKVLRVGLHLQELLLQNTDIDTVYISRTDDIEEVSLFQRTDHANSLGAAWYHSIHSDASAPQYNSTLLLWGQFNNGDEKSPKGGKALSDIMVDILTRGYRTDTRGSIGDCSFYTWSDYCENSGGPYLYVNRNTSMASELSEAGFHTNPRQNQLNMNAEWKRLEAYTFYWSILKFHGIERPAVGIVTGIISDFETEVPLNGATISVLDQTYTTDTYESLFNQYSTDPDQLHNGFYFFEDLPNETLELRVEAEGYYSDTLQVSLTDTFFTFVDIDLISTLPPYVVSSTPSQGDTVFPIWDPIVINFSRIMDTSYVEPVLLFNPAVEGTYNWSDNNTRLTFDPDTLIPETDYEMTISAVLQDIFGNSFDGNGDSIGGDSLLITFTSSPPDIFAPEIESIYPAQVATEIEVEPIINVVYDELIDTTTINAETIKLERFADHTYVEGTLIHYQTAKQSILSFFPSEQLYPDETYITRVAAGIKDLFGNEDGSARSFSFRTTTYSYQVTKIDNFESNLSTNWWAPQQSGSTTGIITDSTSRGSNSEYINLLTAGNTSMQLKYGWDVNAASWLLREYLGAGSPRNILFDKNYLMQVYVFGDGSGNKFRFAVDDNYPAAGATDHEVSPWYTIDWVGWKLVTWDMVNDGTGTWLGNGVLNGTLRYDSFQLSYEPGGALSGTIYLDDLRLVEKISLDVPIVAQPEIPQNYLLSQNYPNPFNPATKIEFGLPRTSHVRLEIYDMNGKLCKKLIDRSMSAGYHSVEMLGNELASGTYIYSLQTPGIRLTRKMVLLK